MSDAPKRIHVRWGKSGDTRVSYMEDRFWPPDNSADYILATPAALAASPEVQALIETTLAALQDPLVVHLNMVAGKIAKPLPSQLVHIYGEDVIRSAFAALIREAEVKMVDRACLAVSEQADWPEDEHGRTEQPELFARVINAIRAEAAAIRGEGK